jgi:2-phosphoglycerate kinase
MYVMGFRQTKGRAFCIVARHIAVMFLVIRTIVEYVGTSANKDNVVAMENVQTLSTMWTIVESVTRSVRMVLNVSMDIVGMPE